LQPQDVQLARGHVMVQLTWRLILFRVVYTLTALHSVVHVYC